MNNKVINVVIKIISIIYFLGAVLDFFVGLGLFFAKDTVIGMFPAYLANYSFVLGIVQLGLAVFGLIVGIALWKTRKWARIAVIIIGAAEILMSLLEIITAGAVPSIIFSGILNIALYTAIVIFLMNRKVKLAFD
jgi:hypothetical protein